MVSLSDVSSDFDIPAPDPVVEALFAVSRIIRQSAARAEAAALSTARYELLNDLLHGGRSRMGSLAGRLGVAARTVTGLVDALEADGCVAREADPADRRATLLVLTPMGQRRLDEARAVRLGSLRELIERALEPVERERLLALLAQVIAARDVKASDV